MAVLAMSQIFIKNLASCNIVARCVRTTRLKPGFDGYNDFQPGHFTGSYPVQQVLPLNLGMMTGMGGPANLEEFYLDVWPQMGSPYYWTANVCQRDDSKPHLWLKATGTTTNFGI